MSSQEVALATTPVAASSLFKPPPQSSRSRPYSRPLPIVAHRCLSPSASDGRATRSAPPTKQSYGNPSPPRASIEPLTSPAFMKGDLNFSTFQDRAARAIAEWGPSAPGSHSPASNLISREASSAPTSHGLKIPNVMHHAGLCSPFPSPPLTPLTPAPYSRPQHREQNPTMRRSSLKFSKRPKPCPLQLKGHISNDASLNDHQCEIEYIRSVRFADGSPLRGSTWHITQYPARHASPPISAANLSFADLVELQTIKQSLGTWCGEIMGSPMRGSFGQSSLSSISDLETQKSSAHPYRSILSPGSYTSSPTSYSQEDEETSWGEAKWPEYPSYDSDCDSEIFEGMH